MCDSFLPTHSFSVISCGHLKIVLKKNKNPKWKRFAHGSAKYFMMDDDLNTRAVVLRAAASQYNSVGCAST